MICPYCTQRPLVHTNAYTSLTCTRSECQEAAYRELMARHPRRKKIVPVKAAS